MTFIDEFHVDPKAFFVELRSLTSDLERWKKVLEEIPDQSYDGKFPWINEPRSIVFRALCKGAARRKAARR